MKTTSFLCCLSISLLATACSRRSTPVDNAGRSPSKMHESSVSAPDEINDKTPRVSPSSLIEPSRIRAAEEIEAERERLLQEFHKISPKTGEHASQAAIAVFSKRGLVLGDVRIFIHRPGCVLEVEQGGRRFRKVLDGFEHCRLGETAEGGKAQVWQFSGGKSRGVLVVDIKANQDDPRCTTKLKTLRLTAQGPRISRAESSNQMCGFRGFETLFFDRLPENEVAMPEVQ